MVMLDPLQTTLPEWAALAPTLVLATTALVLLGIDSIDPDSKNALALAGTSVVGALVALAFAGWFLVAGTGQAGSGGPIFLFGDAVVVGEDAEAWHVLGGNQADAVTIMRIVPRDRLLAALESLREEEADGVEEVTDLLRLTATSGLFTGTALPSPIWGWGKLDADAAVEIAPEVARLMAKELGEDEAWIDDQVAEFEAVAEGYQLHPHPAS